MLGNGKKLFDKGAKPAALKRDVVAQVLGQTGSDPERLVKQLPFRPEGAAITRC